MWTEPISADSNLPRRAVIGFLRYDSSAVTFFWDLKTFWSNFCWPKERWEILQLINWWRNKTIISVPEAARLSFWKDNYGRRKTRFWNTILPFWHWRKSAQCGTSKKYINPGTTVILKTHAHAQCDWHMSNNQINWDKVVNRRGDWLRRHVVCKWAEPENK